jgi:DNA-binding FadR family transcriptional regulator
LKEHERIADAVIAADEALADEAMRAHLGSVVAALRRWAEVDARS